VTFQAINETQFSKRIKEEAASPYPKMTPMNSVLGVVSVWNAVKEDLKLCSNLIFPTFAEELLYGLTERIHNPDLTKVIISD
jgi:hypothetical protein